MKKLSIIAAALVLGVLGTASERAGAQTQAPPPQGQPDSQNDPGVARVSYIHGDVTMQRGDSGDTSAVTLNTPLMAGDKVLTGDGSSAELQLDYADILRLDADAQANIATLANNRIQVQVGQGLASFSVLKGTQSDIEIDTPNVSVHPLREGRYRIMVEPSGDTEVTIRDGEANISTSEGSTKVGKGQLITIHGSGNDAQYRTSEAPPNDAFDTWNSDRDHAITSAESVRHTDPYYTGASDMDPYGVWSEQPDYGDVWFPTVGADWAPYRDGRWVWEPYWGWTWVSYEPWGWAPYHYGRWAVFGGRWGWWPGSVGAFYQPVWAPAYVDFFGFGGGVGVGAGFGFGWGFDSIGWLPIGPCDYFHPWWGGFRDRFAVVDIHNSFGNRDGIRPLHDGDRFSNLRGIETNDRLRNGISGVRSDSFGRGTESPRGISGDEFRQGRMMTGNLPVVPGHDSTRVSNRPVSASVQARANQQQRFFTRSIPSGQHESFSQASSHIQQSIQRDGNFRALNGGAANRPEPQGQSQVQVQGQAQGWNRFGGNQPQAQQQQQPQSRGFSPNQNQSPNRPEMQGRSEQPQAQGNGGNGGNEGWQRFNGGASNSQPRGEAAPRSEAAPRGEAQPNYRPPLDMNKPVVNPRSYGGNEGGYRGSAPTPTPNYRGAPSYSAPAPRSEPSYRSAPAPSYRSAPAPSYRSAPAPSYRSAPAPSYRTAPAPAPRSAPSGGGGGGNRGGGGGSSRSGGGGGNSSRGGGSSGRNH